MSEDKKLNEVELVQEGALAVESAKTLVIANDDTFKEAGEFLLEVKKRVKAVIEYWKPMKQAADAAKKQLLEKEKAMVAPYEQAADIVGKAVSVYQMALAKRAADERKRLEAAAQAEAEERRAREIEEAKESGTPEEVAALEDAPIAPVAVAPIESAIPKVKGLSFTTAWKFEVIDAALVPNEYKVVDEVLLGKVIRAHKGEIKIPGVKMWSEQVPVGRA